MMMLTPHAATFIRNGAIPIEVILRMMYPRRCIQPFSKCTTCFGLKKWLITNTALTNIEITVAIAAPWMPKPNPKMKIGSRITFSTTPIRIVYIDFCGYPEARIMPLKL